MCICYTHKYTSRWGSTRGRQRWCFWTSLQWEQNPQIVYLFFSNDSMIWIWGNPNCKGLCSRKKKKNIGIIHHFFTNLYPRWCLLHRKHKFRTITQAAPNHITSPVKSASIGKSDSQLDPTYTVLKPKEKLVQPTLIRSCKIWQVFREFHGIFMVFWGFWRSPKWEPPSHGQDAWPPTSPCWEAPTTGTMVIRWP